MKTLQDLCRAGDVRGYVESIIVRDTPRAPARAIEATRALAGIGLADDRLGKRGAAELSTRQVTLIQHEHLPVIAQLAHVAAVDPLGLRRNLVVSGLNLLALKQIVGPCHPCSRMEESIGPGGYAAMRGHGGMTARILESGAIRVGDEISVEAR